MPRGDGRTSHSLRGRSGRSARHQPTPGVRPNDRIERRAQARHGQGVKAQRTKLETHRCRNRVPGALDGTAGRCRSLPDAEALRRVRSPLLAGDCESGGYEGRRGTAGQRAHALPMQEPGQETLGRADAPRTTQDCRSRPSRRLLARERGRGVVLCVCVSGGGSAGVSLDDHSGGERPSEQPDRRGRLRRSSVGEHTSPASAAFTREAGPGTRATGPRPSHRPRRPRSLTSVAAAGAPGAGRARRRGFAAPPTHDVPGRRPIRRTRRRSASPQAGARARTADRAARGRGRWSICATTSGSSAEPSVGHLPNRVGQRVRVADSILEQELTPSALSARSLSA